MPRICRRLDGESSAMLLQALPQSCREEMVLFRRTVKIIETWYSYQIAASSCLIGMCPDLFRILGVSCLASIFSLRD